MEQMLPSVKRSSTQAVSILNAQLMSFSMGISSWIWCYSIPKLNFNVLDKNKKSEPIPYRNQVRISQVWWTIQDSNLWPPARQADALPAAPIVQSQRAHKNHWYFMIFCGLIIAYILIRCNYRTVSRAFLLTHCWQWGSLKTSEQSIIRHKACRWCNHILSRNLSIYIYNEIVKFSWKVFQW